MKHKEKTKKEVKMHIFLVCVCKSQDIAQSQQNFALLHDHETVTFRNSVISYPVNRYMQDFCLQGVWPDQIFQAKQP